MNVEVFTNLFQQAIYRVPENYYDSGRRVHSLIDGYGIQDERKALLSYLSRHAERPFCYELYHQARVRMETYYKQNPPRDGDPRIQLQGEVQKKHIEGVMHNFDWDNIHAPLDKQYIPDFLLHSVENGNDQHQLVVIEVKADPKLRFPDNKKGSISEDLCKLQQFIERYGYRQGIFLAINISHDELKQKIDEYQEWIQQHIRDRSKILLMCKESYDAPLFQLNLEQQEFESIPRSD